MNEIKRGKAIFHDAYNFWEKHIGRIGLNRDEFWEVAARDYEQLWVLYERDELMHSMLLALYEDLERVWKEKNNGHRSRPA